MKLAPLPSARDLSAAYDALTWNGHTVSAADWLKWAQWARLDARLGEIWVKAVVQNFASVNPFELWNLNDKSPVPQGLYVLLEFAKVRAKSLGPAEFGKFKQWRQTMKGKIGPAPFQAFFVPPGHPQPQKAIETVAKNLVPYSKWGFYGSENLAAEKNQNSRATLLGKKQRIKILKGLLQSKKVVTATDYIAACGGRVHRRTAERDLKVFKGARATGFTRAKRYKLKRKN